MSRHTPGPWMARHFSVVKGRVSELVIDGPDWAEMAIVYCQEEDGDILGDGEKNALLMAAAPDLLAACEAVVATTWSKNTATILEGATASIGEQVRAAIAKARGQS